MHLLRQPGDDARSRTIQKAVYAPLPDNLITVPACDRCNNGASDDDEVFRNELSIMAGSFGESAKAAERSQPTMRGIRRNRATLTRMVLGAKPVERYSMGGSISASAMPCRSCRAFRKVS